MSEDARFEDGAARPLRLKAEDADDLAVMAALVQDSVFPGSEISWRREERRFALLINRFRWEDRRTPERVRSVLVFDDVTHVASQGVTKDGDMILSLLSMSWEPGEDGVGRLVLILAGDGAFALEAECVNVTLQDVTSNYRAVSGKAPQHPE